MFVLEIENENKEHLRLTNNEDNYVVVKVEGLNPPSAEITTVKVANIHGERFKSSRVEMREITLEIALKGNIENNRLQLYNFLDSGKPCTIYYSNNNRRVKIIGYCESNDCDPFELKETAFVSILCPQPYWQGLETIFTDISQVIGGFSFPFAITDTGIELTKFIAGRETNVINRGDVSTGVILTIKSNRDSVENPVIYNVVTGQFFKVLVTMNAGDVVTVNTNVGEKSIKLTSKGVVSNIIGRVAKGSTWFELNKGTNIFTYSSDSGLDSIEVTMEYRLLYSGV